MKRWHHGHARRGAISKTYQAWRNMIQRCERPTNPDYRRYGGRGIEVTFNWHLFENFLRDMGCCPPGLTLGRKDNDGDYCKTNCEWQTPKEQAANTKRSRLITIDGETKCVSEWARILGIPRPTLDSRLKRGINGAR